MYGCEEQESNHLEYYEEFIFWNIVNYQVNINGAFQKSLDQKEQHHHAEYQKRLSIQSQEEPILPSVVKFQTNHYLTDELIFLRSQIALHLPAVYEKMIHLGLAPEILFSESILILCGDLLNTNIFYRILDFAFGLDYEARSHLGIALILSILAKIQPFLLKAQDYNAFGYILKFTARFILKGS